MNICSCLTKMNKKEDALHSVNEGMKIKETAKGNYKKAQVYLQYINKDCNDVKLGLLYLHRAYELSKDGAILQLMYSVKQEIEEEKRK